jgi:E3 ubiquitin-protein ligase BIG BROTHER-like protein
MLSNLRSAQEEEDFMLQRAIEESKKDLPFDQNQPDPDQMTYEQILELEERNGKVSKGLSKEEISKIPQRIWMRQNDTKCSICFEEIKGGEWVRELGKCKHLYHRKCLDEWLNQEKRCPVCNEQV